MVDSDSDNDPNADNTMDPELANSLYRRGVALQKHFYTGRQKYYIAVTLVGFIVSVGVLMTALPDIGKTARFDPKDQGTYYSTPLEIYIYSNTSNQNDCSTSCPQVIPVGPEEIVKEYYYLPWTQDLICCRKVRFDLKINEDVKAQYEIQSAKIATLKDQSARSTISASDASLLVQLKKNEIIAQFKTFYYQPCNVALDNFMIIFAVLAAGVGFSAPVQFSMFTRMKNEYTKNEQLKDVQPQSDCERHAHHALYMFYGLFIFTAFAGASVIFTTTGACQLRHANLYRFTLLTIMGTLIGLILAAVFIAKKKAQGPGGAAMTRFSISVASFIMMFMAPICLAFSLNHKACYLEDSPRAKQALGCTFMMVLNFGCVMTSVIGILGVIEKRIRWVNLILQLYRVLTIILFVTMLPPLGITLIAFLEPFKGEDYDVNRARYCNQTLAYRSLPKCPESVPVYSESINNKVDRYGGYSSAFGGKFTAPCHPFSLNDQNGTLNEVGAYQSFLDKGSYDTKSEMYKTACMEHGIQPFSWLAGCKHRLDPSEAWPGVAPGISSWVNKDGSGRTSMLTTKKAGLREKIFSCRLCMETTPNTCSNISPATGYESDVALVKYAGMSYMATIMFLIVGLTFSSLRLDSIKRDSKKRQEKTMSAFRALLERTDQILPHQVRWRLAQKDPLFNGPHWSPEPEQSFFKAIILAQEKSGNSGWKLVAPSATCWRDVIKESRQWKMFDKAFVDPQKKRQTVFKDYLDDCIDAKIRSIPNLPEWIDKKGDYTALADLQTDYNRRVDRIMDHLKKFIPGAQ